MTITDSEIQTQSVELRHGPDGIDVELGAKDHIVLLVYLGEVDVVVIFHAHRNAEAKANWTGQQIVRNLFDRLMARFGRFLACKRRSNRILGSRIRHQRKKHESNCEGSTHHGW